MLTVGRAWFAAWPLRVGLGFPTGMRRGLALTGSQGCFQLFMEPLVFRLEAIDLPLLPFDVSLLLLDLLLLTVQLLLANKLEYVRLYSTLLLASGRSHPPYSSRNGVLCPAKSFRRLNSRALQDGKKIRSHFVLAIVRIQGCRSDR